MRFLWEEQKFCVAGTWGSWAQIPGALQELGARGFPAAELLFDPHKVPVTRASVNARKCQEWMFLGCSPRPAQHLTF